MKMKKLRHPGAVMGLFALALEATGVASGAYVVACACKPISQRASAT